MTDASGTAAGSTPSIDESGTFASTPTGPEPYPERPNDLARDDVSAFVRSFERTIVYNSLHEADAETGSVDCTSVYDAAGNGGHYALATCTGYANYADGLHADHGQRPAVYFVSDGLTVRVEDLDHRYRDYEAVFASEDPDRNVERPGDGRSAGFRVYNLDTVEHSLWVTVRFVGGEEPVEAFATEYELPPTAGVAQESVTYRRGAYRVEAGLENGSRTTARWTVADDGDYGRLETSIVIDPAGGLTVREPPFDRLR